MAALARLLLILVVALTVIYVSLSFYSRSVRRGKLERTWDNGIEKGNSGAVEAEGLEDYTEEFLEAARLADRHIEREDFIRQGLEAYDGSLRRKLILGVYVIPILLIGTIIYLTNFR